MAYVQADKGFRRYTQQDNAMTQKQPKPLPMDDVLRRMLATPPAPKKQEKEKPAKTG